MNQPENIDAEIARAENAYRQDRVRVRLFDVEVLKEYFVRLSDSEEKHGRVTASHVATGLVGACRSLKDVLLAEQRGAPNIASYVDQFNMFGGMALKQDCSALDRALHHHGAGNMVRDKLAKYIKKELDESLQPGVDYSVRPSDHSIFNVIPMTGLHN